MQNDEENKIFWRKVKRVKNREAGQVEVVKDVYNSPVVVGE